MKRNKLIKHLKSLGCELYREGSRHSIFINQLSGKVSSVPLHPEIKRFTIESICKDLEIPIPTEK
ncbi:MAG: type II toxin-antitoxin system HicA family toxin [Prolixibacteraceae bacterium]